MRLIGVLLGVWLFGGATSAAAQPLSDAAGAAEADVRAAAGDPAIAPPQLTLRIYDIGWVFDQGRSFLPDVFPGGRTFGVALQMKLRLYEARAAAPPQLVSSRKGLLSRVRALVERNR
jgi:hypothetical protein